MEETISYSQLLIASGICLVLGYTFFLLCAAPSPRRLKAEQLQQREVVRQKALGKKQQIIQESRSRQEQKEQMLLEEFETHLEDRTHDLQAEEEEIELQEQFAAREEQRLSKVENTYKSYEGRVKKVSSELETFKTKLQESRDQLHSGLAEVADVTVDKLKESLSDQVVNDRTLESQRRIKELSEQLQTNSKKSAERTLSRLLARYEPNFVWPKPVSHVEVNNPKIFDTLHTDEATIIQNLTELTDQVEITLSDEKSDNIPAIKLGGGYGIDKEAARLTLEELLPRGCQPVGTG